MSCLSLWIIDVSYFTPDSNNRGKGALVNVAACDWVEESGNYQISIQ